MNDNYNGISMMLNSDHHNNLYINMHTFFSNSLVHHNYDKTTEISSHDYVVKVILKILNQIQS